MLHSEFVNEQADALAKRVAAEVGEERRFQVGEALQLALGRAATEDEVFSGLELIERLVTEHGQQQSEALRYWCLTLLNLSEFAYLD
jgi:hypothetical protein